MGEGIALGHVSLPTTPEAEREELPGCCRGRRFWLTWDGRLDNREELAGALEWQAPVGSTATDAEYVLAAFQRWGDACVDRLLGDWAIVIWDARERRLLSPRTRSVGDLCSSPELRASWQLRRSRGRFLLEVSYDLRSIAISFFASSGWLLRNRAKLAIPV